MVGGERQREMVWNESILIGAADAGPLALWDATSARPAHQITPQ